MKKIKSTAGFTLIELMIVVAIIGILAATAIPAFVGYIRKSKTVEATQNVNLMAKGVASYFATERAQAGNLLTLKGCTPPVTANIPAAVPGANKRVPAANEFGASIGMTAINFDIADPIYYSYAITVSGVAACNPAAAVAAASAVRAQGDLDGDLTLSSFTQEFQVSAARELQKGGGIIITNESE